MTENLEYKKEVELINNITNSKIKKRVYPKLIPTAIGLIIVCYSGFNTIRETHNHIPRMHYEQTVDDLQYFRRFQNRLSQKNLVLSLSNKTSNLERHLEPLIEEEHIIQKLEQDSTSLYNEYLQTQQYRNFKESNNLMVIGTLLSLGFGLVACIQGMSYDYKRGKQIRRLKQKYGIIDK